MARPTRYCVRCGEYVDERYVTRRHGGQLVTDLALVHIAGDGTRLHRAHQALEDLPYQILNADGVVAATAPSWTAAATLATARTKARLSPHTVRAKTVATR